MPTLRENLDVLLQLQQLDSERDKLARHKNGLDSGTKASQEAAAAQAEYEKKRAELTQINGALKDAELELAGIEKKIKDYEAKMRQGTITNTREVMNFEKEFNQLNRQRTSLDDKILNLMVESETKTAAANAAQSKVETLNQVATTAKSTYHAELSKIELALGRLNGSRTELLTLVTDPALAKRYDTLRAKPGNGGIAVAKATDSGCGACHMQIGTIDVTHARKGDQLAICENCGRIMA